MHHEKIASLIRRSTVNAWIALEGRTEPHAREMRERMAYPAMGDYVAETSSVLSPTRSDLDDVGKLVDTSWEREHIGPYGEFDAEDAGRDRPQRLVHEIETFDGRTVQVTGHMVAVLTSISKRSKASQREALLSNQDLTIVEGVDFFLKYLIKTTDTLSRFRLEALSASN